MMNLSIFFSIIFIFSCTIQTTNLDDGYNYGGYFYARKPQSWVYRENISNSSNILYSIGFYSIATSASDKFTDNILVYVFNLKKSSSYTVDSLYEDISKYRDSLLSNYSQLQHTTVLLSDSTKGILDIYKSSLIDLNGREFELRSREYIFLRDSIYYQILCNSEDSVYGEFTDIFDSFISNFHIQ